MNEILLEAFKDKVAEEFPNMERAEKALLTRKWNQFVAGYRDFNHLMDQTNWITIQRAENGNEAYVGGYRGDGLGVEFALSQLRPSRRVVNRMLREIRSITPAWARLSVGPNYTRIVVADENARFANVRRETLRVNIARITSGQFYYLMQMHAALTQLNGDMIAQYRAAASRLNIVAQQTVVTVTQQARNGRSFEEYLTKRRDAITAATRDDLLRIAEPDRAKASTRRWGIEIEHIDTKGVEAPRDWNAKYDGSLNGVSKSDENSTCADCDPRRSSSDRVYIFERARRQLRTEGGERIWDGCDCGGCTTGSARDGHFVITDRRARSGARIVELLPTPDFANAERETTWLCTCNTQCREFVSPILTKQGSDGLKQLMADLEGREVNTTPGVHVHVEASDLTLKQQARLVRNYALIEPIIESLYQRKVREYCKSHDVDEVALAATIASGRSDERDMRFDRYMSLNLQALDDHGTVEFRAMGPVYDHAYLIRWAQFVREFVNVSALDIPQSTWAELKTFEDILKLLKLHGSEIDFS